MLQYYNVFGMPLYHGKELWTGKDLHGHEAETEEILRQRTLRDWDMIRGFAAGGLGLTRQHVPAVVGAGLLVGGVVAVAAATVLVAARWLCRLRRRRRASYGKLQKLGEYA